MTLFIFKKYLLIIVLMIAKVLEDTNLYYRLIEHNQIKYFHFSSFMFYSV